MITCDSTTGLHVTCMLSYGSLQELRVEDYASGRKGPTGVGGLGGGGLFGGQQQQTGLGGGLFGSQKPLGGRPVHCR